MTRFLIRRLLISVVTLFATSVATFMLFFAVPASPALLMCGKQCDANAVTQTEKRLGIDQPLTVQYGRFLSGIFVGRTYGEGELAKHCEAPCLGYSFRTDEEVTSIIARTLPVTFSIVGGSTVLYLFIGVGLGMISALRRGTLLDRAAVATTLAGASMQVYFLGLVLLLIFVYGFDVVPPPSYTSPLENPIQWAGGMLLPWFTLGFLNSAIYARLSRAQMLETLAEDYIRTARAKGLRKWQVYGRHALRGAITPIVTIAGLNLGSELGGTVITETVFGLNGVGRTAVQAVGFLNLPVVMATVMLAAVFVIGANIVVDMLYSVIDPRVRMS